MGEFAVLDAMMKTGQFSLLNVEEELSNGLSIDFLMRDNNDHNIHHVEVVNINLSEDNKNLKKVFRRKVVSKVNTKKKDLVEIIDLTVVPVIWARRPILQQLNDAYNEQFKVKHAYEPFAFSAEPNAETGEGEYRFHRILNLFNQE